MSIDVRPIDGTNVCHRFRIRPATSRPAWPADVIVEEIFRTPSAAHAPMEPHATLAEWEDGRLTLWTGTQTPFNTRADLAGLFGIHEDAIRVISNTVLVRAWPTRRSYVLLEKNHRRA